MPTKTFPACVKAAEPGDQAAVDGEFQAIVSVFDNVDSVGDVVRPGAFAETLADWKASGNPIPVLWSHRMDDPMFNVGKVLEAAELGPQDSRLPDWAPDAVKANGGLWIRALIDQGADASPIAAQTHRLLKQGRVTQFSFAYDVIDGGRQTVDGEDAYELRKLKLYEASVTQVGANQDTTLLGVKDRPAVAAKAGRVLSAKNETAIRKAVELLSGVLAALDKDDAGNGEPAKDEEPDGAKSEELSHVDARLLADLGIAEVALLL